MSVLRVTARLASDVAAREQVHLDSVLQACSPQCPRSRPGRVTPIEDIADVPLPIVRLSMGCRWDVPICSAWQIPSTARPELQHIVARKDPVDVAHRARPWTPSSGPEKNYMVPLPTVLAPSVSWVCVGSRRGVMELTRYVRQLGSVRRHGYGVVLGWSVDEIDVDPLRALVTEDGRAARFLPEEWVDWSEAVEVGPVAPPYWHPAMRTRRIRPGTRCVLKEHVVERVKKCH